MTVYQLSQRMEKKSKGKLKESVTRSLSGHPKKMWQRILLLHLPMRKLGVQELKILYT